MSPTSRASDTALLLIHQPPQQHHPLTDTASSRASKEHTESKQHQQKKAPNTRTTRGRITKGENTRVTLKEAALLGLHGTGRETPPNPD